MENEKKQKRINKFREKWTTRWLVMAMLIIGVLLILIYPFYIAAEADLGWCHDNYSTIFSNSQSDLINYERANEDKLRMESSAYNKCWQLNNYFNYYVWSDILLAWLFMSAIISCVFIAWYKIDKENYDYEDEDSPRYY